MTPQLVLRGKDANVWGFEVQTCFGGKIMLRECTAWSTPRIQTGLVMRSPDPLILGSQGLQPMLLGVTAHHRYGCICFYSSPLKDLRILRIFAIMVFSGKKNKNIFKWAKPSFLAFLWHALGCGLLCTTYTLAQMLLWLPKQEPRASDTIDSAFRL